MPLRRSALIAVLGPMLVVGSARIAAADSPPTPPSTAPNTPPAQICGDAATLSGPSSPPAGAVRVDPGGNVYNATLANPPGTTFWLSPGVHTLGTSMFGQVEPKAGNTYIGAPGAILDGQTVNRYAFTQNAPNVTIKYLTIRNFRAPMNEGVVNHDLAAGWVMDHLTVQLNTGAGVLLGDNNRLSYSCLADNAQYGLQGFGANFTIDHNEVARNDTQGYEAQTPGCGCSGGAKFWDAGPAAITANFVHDNHNVGMWADTNNIGFLFDGNYFSGNDSHALVYETSYNARIVNNTFRRNAIVQGQAFQSGRNSFPVSALYISESGGDARVNGGTYATMDVSGNLFEDNWGGVVLWENADRFCGSPVNTSTGYCTKGNPGATTTTCSNPATGGQIAVEPYKSDCRWKTQNVSVANNDFRMDKAAIGCTSTYCGTQALMSNVGTTPSWSPYLGTTVEDAITYGQHNSFSGNRYVGDWKFAAWDGGRLSFDAWRSAPYNQEAGSTLNGVTPPVIILPSSTNSLDADTATLEGSMGQWVPWFSANVSQSTLQAHTGTHSLKVDVTALYGWGVNQQNFPGFAATPGPKTLSFWAMAGSGANLATTMTVKWRNAAGTDIQTDVVTMPLLTSSWQQATASVTAPAGTARVGVTLSSSTGGPGSTVYLDDLVVGAAGSPPPPPPPPPPTVTNDLDADTSTLEAGVGQWVPWFSANVSQSTLQAHTGTHSLKVDVTALFGWGVTQKNFPGFTATAGPHTLSFWAMAGSGANLATTMTVKWRNAAGADLQTDVVTIPLLTSSWQQATSSVTAPAGTAKVGVTFSNALGLPGNTVYIDDVVVS